MTRIPGWHSQAAPASAPDVAPRHAHGLPDLHRLACCWSGAGLATPCWPLPAVQPRGWSWRPYLRWPASRAPPSRAPQAAGVCVARCWLRHRRPGLRLHVRVGAVTCWALRSGHHRHAADHGLAGLRAGLLLCALQVTALLLLHQSTTPAASAVTVTSQTPDRAADRAADPDAGQPGGGGLIHHLMAHRSVLRLRDQERLADWDARRQRLVLGGRRRSAHHPCVSPLPAQSGRDVEAFMRIGQPGRAALHRGRAPGGDA